MCNLVFAKVKNDAIRLFGRHTNRVSHTVVNRKTGREWKPPRNGDYGDVWSI